MPPMGDEGIPLASCITHFYHQQSSVNWYQLSNAYLGPSYSTPDFIATVSDDFKCIQFDDNQHISVLGKLIDNDYVIGRFSGRMELGPRALGNRSILANARERELNNTLNDRLNRSEFMPFAPIIADSLAVKCLESFDLDDPTYNFMTATVSVTDMFNEKCPAAVHIDKTARPQIVSSTQNQFIHSLLTYMYEHYGDLSLVNTSYNLHEEPIVCTPSDAFPF